MNRVSINFNLRRVNIELHLKEARELQFRIAVEESHGFFSVCRKQDLCADVDLELK